MVLDAAGNVIALRDHRMSPSFPGYYLQQISPTGTLLWDLVNPTQWYLSFDFGADPVGLATDDTGLVAVAFQYGGLVGGWMSYVAVYAP